MKRLTFAAALLAALAGPAQIRGQAGDDGFAIGIVAGEPTGLTLRAGDAIQVHAAWSFTGDAALMVNLDYLFYRRSFPDVPRLDWYVGVGARGKFSDKFRLGGRIPVGLRYLFQDAPMEVFGEVAPVLDVIPETELWVNGAIGVRFIVGRMG